MSKDPTQDDLKKISAALDALFAKALTDALNPESLLAAAKHIGIPAATQEIAAALAPSVALRDEARALAFWQGVCAERARWVGVWP